MDIVQEFQTHRSEKRLQFKFSTPPSSLWMALHEAMIALVNLDDSLVDLIHFVARLIYFNWANVLQIFIRSAAVLRKLKRILNYRLISS